MSNKQSTATRRKRNRSCASGSDHVASPTPEDQRAFDVVRHPLEAAWDVGRQLNYLSFQLRQAWLAHDGDMVNRASNTWDELALSVRELGTAAADQDSQAYEVRRLQLDWGRCFGTEHHAEVLAAKNHEIEKRLRLDPDIKVSDARIDACHEIAGQVDPMPWLQSEIESVLDEDRVLLLRLGIHIDRGIHPPKFVKDNFLDWYQVPVQSSETDETSSLLGQGHTQMNRVADCHLPVRCLENVEQHPSEQWWRETQQRWNQIVLQIPRLSPSSVLFEYEGQYSVVEVAEILSNELAGYVTAEAPEVVLEDSGAEDELQCTVPIESDAGANYLGIILSNRDQTIRREGSAHTIQLRDQPYKLAVHFVNQRESRTVLTWFQQNWRQFGQCGGCRAGTVYDAISVLNKEMLRLDLTIDSEINHGWALRDIHGTERRDL